MIGSKVDLAKLQRYWPFVILTLAFFWLAHSLLSISHYSAYSTSYAIDPTPKPIHSSQATPVEPSSLFGDYISVDPTNIPLSLLGLKLKGVLKATNVARSQAIIAIDDEEEHIYHTKQLLPGGARLIEILDTSALIEYQGHIERLRLPEYKLSFNAPLTHPLEMNHD